MDRCKGRERASSADGTEPAVALPMPAVGGREIPLFSFCCTIAEGLRGVCSNRAAQGLGNLSNKKASEIEPATALALLTPTEMAEADRRTIAGGTAGIALMENAGRAVADAVAARHPPGTRIAIVAGPGNNGGDGFVAARILAERGYRVRLFLLGTRELLKGDAALAAQRWTGAVDSAEAAALAPADATVDALFGAGLDRPVEDAGRALIEA